VVEGEVGELEGRECRDWLVGWDLLLMLVLYLC
jgi:hypothetical protein